MAKTIGKWVGIVVGALLVLILVAVGVIYWMSSSHFSKTYDIEVADLEIPSDKETVKWGKHIAHTRGCQDCHGENFGGDKVLSNFMMGTVKGANLTPGKGGIGDDYDDEDWLRAIRHGVSPDGKPLLFMPAHEYNALGKRDIKALVAYLKTLDPVDNKQPDPTPGPMMRMLYLQGNIPLLVSAQLIDHSEKPQKAPPVAPTREYGKYVANMCKGCHGKTFTGGPIPGMPPSFPPAANITPHKSGIKGWSREDWENALTQGKLPNGKKLDKEYMPWNLTKRLEKKERTALYKYFISLEPKKEGNR